MEWSRSNPIEFALAVGFALFALLILARRTARTADARSLLLTGLRASALAVLVAILIDPVETTRRRLPGERPTAVYLVDGSRSMGLERPTSRLDRVDRVIARAEGSIGPERLPSIERYRFGRSLAASPPGEPSRAIEDESRLLDALERLPSRFGPALPFGVFVFSDGRATESSGFAEVAEGYRKLKVPIHVLPVGDASISGDVSIRDLVFPRDAPKGSKIAVKVVVGSRGYAGQRAEIAVRPATGDVRPLATLPLTLVDGDQPAELVIEADRAHQPLVAEVSSLPGESVAENNAIPFQVAARNNKVRVIYMEGSPDPEYAFIRDALVENPDIECLAMSLESQNSSQHRLHRVEDPSRGYPATREELLGYDVVICSDIARTAFTPEQIQWTVELVAKRGGGFAMIGGNTSFGSGGWDKTAWDGMIPIDMSGDGPGQYSSFYNGTFRVVVPSGVDTHPIWRMADDPVRNREILARMPPFYGTNLTDRLKPAATLLGLSDHPLTGMAYLPQGAVQTRTKRQAPAATGTPIFSAQTYGRGRSFAMSTDSTVSWGSDFERNWGEGDNRYFRKFWRNVVTWLAENSTGSSRKLELSTDKIIYRPGQPILVTARAFDQAFEPTDRYRLVARLVRPAPRTPNTPNSPPLVADSTLAYRVESRDFAIPLPVPSAASIRGATGSSLQGATVEVEAFDGDQTVSKASLDVQILDDSEEFRDPRPDPARLSGLAHQSGGKILAGPDDLAELLQAHSEPADRVVTTRSPLWDTPVLMGLIFTLLAAEWTIRRWMGLA